MPVPLSLDLRRRIIAAWKKKGLTTEELAERFEVGPASVTRLKALFRATGSIQPRPHGGGRERLIGIEEEHLVEDLVRRYPDWTEGQYAERLQSEHGIVASDITVGRVIRRLGYSVKKRRSPRQKGTAQQSPSADDAGGTTSEASPLRVWFSWTKRARTSR